ncbi:hypothetical protein DF027_15555 [Burkholderia cenocepacia]|nr:hypothetical protein DF028_15435 [Burkholderia cenocepacia]RQV43306.1 hypothetical protein DF027_15555 [Burkholderia cenocepacia]RQV83954.1 hypothetical protein DF010_03320 [Burkholderia cenocepacia]
MGLGASGFGLRASGFGLRAWCLVPRASPGLVLRDVGVPVAPDRCPVHHSPAPAGAARPAAVG